MLQLSNNMTIFINLCWIRFWVLRKYCVKKKKKQKPEKLGQQRKLSEAQEVEIIDLISRRRPFQLGFKLPYKKTKQFLWTRDLVIQLIMRKCKVQLTDGGLVNYLTRWGFPKLNNEESKLELYDKTTREWLRLHLAVTLTRGKDENAQIDWLGHNKSITLHPSKSDKPNKFTFVPVISNQGRLNWLTIRGKFSPERQVMLLRSLVGQTTTKIFLIRKTATHFNTRLVKDWLNQNQHAIEIFPPPEWQDE